jgi:hypothetical protein
MNTQFEANSSIEVNSSKLNFTKEKVANLSDLELGNIAGGDAVGGSTKHDFTCSWCTSTTA